MFSAQFASLGAAVSGDQENMEEGEGRCAVRGGGRYEGCGGGCGGRGGVQVRDLHHKPPLRYLPGDQLLEPIMPVIVIYTKGTYADFDL